MKWEIVQVHYDGDVKKWRAVCYNEESVIVQEYTFAFLSQAEKFIEEKNESL